MWYRKEVACEIYGSRKKGEMKEWEKEKRGYNEDAESKK